MGFINYRIKQSQKKRKLVKVFFSCNYALTNTLPFALRYCRAVDLVAKQAADHSCPTGRIGVVSNFKKFAAINCDGVHIRVVSTTDVFL